MKPYNVNLTEVLRLSNDLMHLADKGDLDRDDIGCGILYGVMRDSAHQLKQLADNEIKKHKKNGKWNQKH